MKAIILDGSFENDTTAGRVFSALAQHLQSRGWIVEHVLLREQKIGNCAGDFFCWVRSPGMCNVDDDNREIAAAVAASDLMVYLTPVTFGGYSSALKRMVDHQIQNISPFFANIDGETHHQKRYNKYPDMLVLGWMDGPDADAEAVFRNLIARNAINFYAKKAVAGLVLASQSDAQINATVQTSLENLSGGVNTPLPELPFSRVEGKPGSSTGAPIRRALLLVGSPRTRKSTSQSLGGTLFEHLNVRSIQTETIYLHTVLRSPEKMNNLYAVLDAADLIVLAFPIYVDSLPAPVIEALERIAARLAGREAHHHPLFCALSNCGFPEVAHNNTALAICELFARQAGFSWAGALALGGGEMVHGMPLNELDGRAIPIKNALELAANALADGNTIPRQAQNLLDKPLLPAWIYRFLGGFGWKEQAKKYGAQNLLKRKTYLVKK
jgi:multimeric flavodoxin WrbA